MVKPSELAPAASALLARLLPLYVDPGAVLVVEGDSTTAQQLLACGFDLVLFTGGSQTGKEVMTGAASTLTPTIMELGGKCPVVVTSDADIDVAARRIAWVKLINSGQTCIAPDYVLADRSIRDDLVSKIVQTMREFRGNTASQGLRILNERHFDRLTGCLDATRGTVVAGGESDRVSLTIEPTIIIDPDPAEPLMTDEIFGPILPVLTFDSVDEVIDLLNERPKPLALYLFTKSKALSRRLTAEVPAGGVVVNHVAVHCYVPQLPFGGVGASGMGHYHGRWGFEAFSHAKSVLVKRSRPDPRLFYPPYTQRTLSILRRLF